MSSQSSPTLNKRAAELIREMVKLQIDIVDVNLFLVAGPSVDRNRCIIAGNQMLDLAQVAHRFEMPSEYSTALLSLGKSLLTSNTPFDTLIRCYQTAKDNYQSIEKGLYEMPEIFYVYIEEGEYVISSVAHRDDAPMTSGTLEDCQTYVNTHSIF